jgi:Cu/Ag efflux protein CusF
MRTTTIILAGATAVSIFGTAALAQQGMSGTITQIDRLNGTISIQQTPSGTVGAGSNAVQEFKVQDANKLEPFHAGDKVNFSAAEGSGAKTITDLKKQ